nr:immunoglobulin light chain junction region [Macaca mulatta]MPN85313.1 immunoglobulin light chain junction region [Macaca mulatta]
CSAGDSSLSTLF